jgi:hypothetical protein
MSLKKNIFDGHHEEELFEYLKSKWNSYFNIYPQLPFSKIIDINKLTISDKERDFLYKTNIDYTICDKENRPKMCIEFDGMSYGYSRENSYIQLKPDSLRKKKLELKLKIASDHLFPFYIISYPEKKYISEKMYLTVIDGVIGQTIAKQELAGEINKRLEDQKDYLEPMQDFYRDEHIQDLVTSIEVELELTWDPIAKMASEIELILFQKDIAFSTSYKPLSRPELPNFRGIDDIEGLTKRIEALKNIEWHGYEVIVETRKGKVSETAWVRNIESDWASPIIISKNIAELLALYKAAEMNGIVI